MEKKTTNNQTHITSVGTVNTVKCSKLESTYTPADGFEGKGFIGVQKLGRILLGIADLRH